MAQIYFRDRFIDAAQPLITTDDRAFRFGDGVFETALISHGRLLHWNAHQSRLQRGLDFFELNVSLETLHDTATELLRRNKVGEGYLRIIISRGTPTQPSLGYASAGETPYLVMTTQAKPLPAYQHLTLHLSTIPLSWKLPCKILSALPYVMAMRQAAQAGADNALMLSASGHVCETASGNLFWIKGETLYTPADDLPFIPGTMREAVLHCWDGPVDYVHALPDALREADEIFMSNIGTLIASIAHIAPLDITPPATTRTQALRHQLIHYLEEHAA